MNACCEHIDLIDHINRKNKIFPENRDKYILELLEKADIELIDHNNRKNKIFPENRKKYILELLEIAETCCDHIDRIDHKNPKIRFDRN